MAKRKKRTHPHKSRPRPNIPESTLNKAREGNEHEGAVPPEIAEEIENMDEEQLRMMVAAQRLEQMREERYQKREQRAKSSRSTRRKRDDVEVTPEMVAEQLAHPTKTVTSDELRNQYNYVLNDLRNMGLLAAALFLALIGLGVWQTL